MGTMVLVVLALFVGGAIAYYMTRNTDAENDYKAAMSSDFRGPANQLESDDGQRPLSDLHLNDVVTYYEYDLTVEGRITYTEGSWQWRSFRLEDGDKQLWLGIEQDDGLEISMWEELPTFEVDSPPPSSIDYDGETFRRIEDGVAETVSIGRTGRPERGSVHYYDYESETGRGFSVEDWEGDVEVSVGTFITENELTVFPGDDVA